MLVLAVRFSFMGEVLLPLDGFSMERSVLVYSPDGGGCQDRGADA